MRRNLFCIPTVSRTNVKWDILYEIGKCWLVISCGFGIWDLVIYWWKHMCCYYHCPANNIKVFVTMCVYFLYFPITVDGNVLVSYNIYDCTIINNSVVCNHLKCTECIIFTIFIPKRAHRNLLLDDKTYIYSSIQNWRPVSVLGVCLNVMANVSTVQKSIAQLKLKCNFCSWRVRLQKNNVSSNKSIYKLAQELDNTCDLSRIFFDLSEDLDCVITA
jgi:hypothetical protein